MLNKAFFDLTSTPAQNLLSILREAEAVGSDEPTAMVLATVGVHGEPNSRVVLFKGLNLQENLTFYTNYQSIKALEIEKSSKVSVVFFWPKLAIQVRIKGVVEKLSRELNEDYFSKRPRISQIGAWASTQSTEIPNYEYLMEQFAKYETKFANKDVPCPENWGGYQIIPSEFEFWFGIQGRLHHRYLYLRTQSGWDRKMLSP